MLAPHSGTVQDELARCIGGNLRACEVDQKTAVRRVLCKEKPHRRFRQFIQNYKRFDLETDFGFGPDVAEFQMYIRNDFVRGLDASDTGGHEPPNWDAVARMVEGLTGMEDRSGSC